MYQPELFQVVEDGNLKRLRELIIDGVDLNLVVQDENNEFHLYSSLHIAAQKNHLEIARELIKNGVYPDKLVTYYENGKRIEGASPLMVASYSGNVEVVRELIKNGVYVDRQVQSPDRTISAISLAIVQKHIDVVHELVKNGANTLRMNSDGEGPLDMVFEQDPSATHNPGKIESMFDYLLSIGANVKGIDMKGRTIFHKVARSQMAFMVDKIVRLGVDINQTDFEEMTPLHLAMTPAIAREMIKHGAEIEARDNLGETPLFKMTGYYALGIARVLIEFGADVNTTNYEGYTLLQKLVTEYPSRYDLKEHYTDLARDLLKNGATVPIYIPEYCSPKLKILLQNHTKSMESLKNYIEELSEKVESTNAKYSQCQAEVSSIKSELEECKVEKSSIREQLNTMEEEISDISEKMSRVREESTKDKDHISRLNLIRDDLEERIRLLTTSLDNGVLENEKLLSEISRLRDEISVLKRFMGNQDKAPDTNERTKETPTKGYECVKPYSKTTATKKDRLNSCKPIEGGLFDNIRTALGGRFTNRQKCIEVCTKD